MFELDEEIIEDLKSLDTPTVCNAIEVINPQRRGYGYTTKPLSCLRPNLKPVVAIARTARIRAMHPTDLSQQANSVLLDQYYEYIDDGPKDASMGAYETYVFLTTSILRNFFGAFFIEMFRVVFPQIVEALKMPFAPFKVHF